MQFLINPFINKRTDMTEWMGIGYSSKDMHLIISFSETRPIQASHYLYHDSALIYDFKNNAWTVSGGTLGPVRMDSGAGTGNTRSNFISMPGGDMGSIAREETGDWSISTDNLTSFRIWQSDWRKMIYESQLPFTLDIYRRAAFITKAWDFGHPGVRKKI